MPAPAAVCPRARTVLVVDDEQVTLAMLSARLRREHYHVVTASDGIAAIEIFERIRPDIVFLDVMLPDLYGFEVARAIKRIAGERFVPVIFLTGLSEREALNECVAAGGDYFLSKPLDMLTLSAKIAAIERIRELYERLRSQREELAELHERMQYEQSIAEQVFNDIVMAANVAVPPILSWLKSASTFNGDLFLSCYTPGGGMSVLLGDFTGHGLAAAIGALPTAETFRSMTAKGFSLIDVVAEINRKLNCLLPTGIFLAAAALRIDPDLKTALAWNSGMPEMILCRGDGSRRLVASHHPPLGVMPEFMPGTQTERIILTAGDVFVLCSDGLTEACNEQGEQFGEARFFAQIAARNAAEAFEAVRHTVASFVGEAEQQDDISLLVIPCNGELLAGADALRTAGISHDASAPWQWMLRLEGSNLRHVDPVPLIMHHLKTFGLPARHLQQIYVVVIELFNNALDHGVLGLDSAMKLDATGFMEFYQLRQARLDALQEGFIEIRFDYRQRDAEHVLSIGVEDSGHGFCHLDCDHCKVPEVLRSANQTSVEPSNDASATDGRGLRLIKTLCRGVHYRGAGNRVEAEYIF
jgi:CheY-like chemotaxis protein/two-component sensor histidine kinase